MNKHVTLNEYLRNGSKAIGIRFISGTNEENFISYNELYKTALRILGYLQHSGLKKGDELIFQIEDNQTYLSVFWGCLIGGIVPVPINPAYASETRSKLINVWNTLKNPNLITEQKVYQSFGPKIDASELNRYDPSKLFHINDMMEWNKADGIEQEIDENDTAFIQFSSGSTGTPKGVVLTHKNLITNAWAIVNNSDARETDSTLGWMPLTHDLGLIGFHITPLVLGINQLLIPTNVFVRKPSIWFEKINQYRVTYTASPNFGYKHFLSFFKEEVAQTWDLSCVRRIMNGAEPISSELCFTFLYVMKKFGLKETTMYPVYGMAEASLAVAFPKPDTEFEHIIVNRDKLSVNQEVALDDTGISFVCVGTAVNDCQIRITNENYLPLEQKRVGFIEIKGDNVTSGYYNNPDANKELFTSDNWLRTGDIGFFYDEKLYITGRSKDIIFSNGLNLYPHDLERVAEGCEGVELGKVVFCGTFNEDKQRDEILVFVLHKGSDESFVPLAIELKSYINKRISIEVDYVLPTRSIEKTTSGKVKRFHYVQEYKRGAYKQQIDNLHELIIKSLRSKKMVKPQSPLELSLFKVWSEILENDEIGIYEDFFELGGNSLKANMLIGKIAQQMNIEVSIRDIFKFPTISSLAIHLQDKKEQKFTSIPKISERKYYPSSSAQKRIFILNQLDEDSINYNITSIHRLKGKIDVDRIREVFEKIVDKHTILRTTFQLIDGELVQKVNTKVPVNLQTIPFESSIENTAKKFIQPFNIFNDVLFRLALTKESDEVHYLIFDIHHIVSDGFSLNLIIKEFSELYQGNPVIVSDTSYIDYAVWQADFYKTEKIKNQEKFWLEQFSEDVPVLNFPTDYPRPKNIVQIGSHHTFKIEKDLYKKIVNLADNESTTFYILFLSALQIVLSKYSSQDDIIIGSPITNRPHADLQKVFGPFINTLAIRTRPQADKTVRQYLREVKEHVLNAFTNQDYPFEQLIEKLSLERDLSRNALFDILFVLQNANDEKISLPNLNVEQVDYFNGATKFDLNIHATEENNTFKVKIEYRSDLFKEESIVRFATHFKNVLHYISENQVKKLGDIDYLADSEKKILLEKYNNTSKPFGYTDALSMFRNQVQKKPENKAVVTQATSMTYAELDSCSSYYAEILTKQKIGNGDFVGIMLPADEKLIIAILAVWKTGATYVPIDPTNPEDRRTYIFEDSGIKALFSDIKTDKLYCCEIDSTKRTDKVNTSEPGESAYVIYTSGTTGKPKGTLVKHSGLANYAQFLNDTYKIGEKDSTLLLTSYAFDLGYTSVYGALLNGGTLHFISEEDRKEPNLLVDYITDKQLTFIKTTPSQLFTITNATNFEKLAKAKKLSKIFIGGESIKTSDIRRVLEINPKINFINHYGPTESTIGCVTYKIENIDEFEAQTVIGKPISNVQLYVLDSYKKLLPVGVEGEIHIAGAGLAKTYLNNPEQFAEKFISNPFEEGKLMYATGDVGKWTKNGTIQFLGRNDDQVKIRGYRVEVKEVENKLKTISQVKDAIVLSFKDNDGNNYLCAYVVTDDSGLNYQELLSAHLPEYMIPSYFMEIDMVPITANGKLNKKALPRPELRSIKEKVLPTTEIQHKLVAIWKEVLGNSSEVGIDDNFFEVGGHSLKATIVIAQIHKQFNVEIPLKEFFQNPKIEQLEKLIQSKEKNPYSEIPVAEHQEYYAVSSAQKRMFVLNKLEGDSTSYNMPGAFWAKGPLDLKRLTTTFQKILDRHESLRTSFEMKDGEPVQIIHKKLEFKPELLSNTGEEIDVQIKKFIRPFNLSDAPLFRVGVLPTGDNEHLLMFDIHHIISDGSSMGLIVKDFVSLYDNKQPEKLRIQYKDYSVWQKEFFKSEFITHQKSYWKKQFAGELPVLQLPTDFERPKIQTFEGESFTFRFEAGLTSKLRTLCKEQDITMFMLLMGVYNIFLARQTGQEEFIIGTPIAGRRHSDLQNLIGVFLNTLAIRSNPSPDKKVINYLEEVKQTALKAYENQDYPFDEIIESINIVRNLNRNPLFDTMLVVQNMNIDELRTKEINFTQHEFDLGSTQLDLSLIVFENGPTLDFTVNYNTNLFKRKTVEKFIKSMEAVARQIITGLEKNISEIEILSEQERKELIVNMNDNALAYDKSITTMDLLDKQFAANASKTAILHEDTEITYAELDKKANQLANRLIKEGAKANMIIPIMMERSIRTIIAILGVEKSGAAYVFVDPAYPTDRIEFMLADSKSTLLLTETVFEGKVNYTGKSIFLDKESMDAESAVQPKITRTLDQLAYIIYTSGSTGRPKGVMINHKNMLSFIIWSQHEFKNTDFEITYNATSYSFDLSIFEIFYTLSVGKKIRVIQDGLQIGNYLHKDKKILINTVPVVVKELLASKADFSNVTAINMAGEPIPQKVKNEIDYKNIEVRNLYGPSEDTTYSTCYRFTEHVEMQNIGKPIANTQIYILDKRKALLPIGVPGELCISGDGLSSGYFNREELTNEKFVDHPFEQGIKIYKTGDLARRLENGDIEYLGRIDNQVKIRGFRIELEEIERKMFMHPEVADCVVIDRMNGEGDKFLCAYYKSKSGIEIKDLRAHLSESLPNYMVPAVFMQIAEMPTTPNGKTDKKALPEPDFANLTEKVVMPVSKIEKLMVEAWQEVLGVKAIGVTTNFFSLGGDSIKAIQVASKLQQHDLKLQVKQLFEYPTIKELAPHIVFTKLKIEQGPVTGAFELGPIQYDFFAHKFEEPNHWNQAIILKSGAKLDEQKLQEVFTKLIAHHDILRTSFAGGKADIQPIEKVTFELGVFTGDNEAELLKKANELQASLAIDKAKVINAIIFRTTAADHLLIVMHHLVTDGISWRILAEDLQKLYKDVPLALKTNSFKDWTDKLKSYAETDELNKEADYWNKIVQESSITQLKTAKENTLKNSGRESMQLEQETAKELLGAANVPYNTEANDLLLTALSRAYYRWQNTATMTLNLEGHGREELFYDIDISRTIGWFTSIFPVNLNYNEDTGEHIKQTKDYLHKIPNKGVGYGILKRFTEKIKTTAPQISFNYLGDLDNNANAGIFSFSELPTGKTINEKNHREHQLDINAMLKNGNLVVEITYPTETMGAEEIHALLAIYKEELTKLTQFCLNKEDVEVTLSDIEFDISSDDFENIFK